MGKKSSRRFRSRSLGSPSFAQIKNNGKIKKKKSNKMNKNIRKLFQQFHYNSDSSNSFHSANNTVIEIGEETTKQESLHTVNNNNNINTSNLIILDDDDLVINNEPCPLQCSTPISNTKLTLKKEDSHSRINNNSNLVGEYHQEVEDLTKEINNESYLTIDLTNETCFNKSNTSQIHTVIDLANTTDDQNNTLSNDSISLSGDSDVTVINMKKRNNKLNKAQMKKFAQGIAMLDSSERGKLLEFIAHKIFKDARSRPNSANVSLQSIKNGVCRATETIEDTYIKEVILGQGCSSNSIGSNIYNPERDIKNKTGLRMIVIDGSNVAMQHTNGRVFSVKGLRICIEYFLQRGHVVKAFVPRFRCKYGKSTDGRLLDQLERQGLVIYTPSREIQGRMITSYDDRYIVQCAAEFDGVIVSGDNYRDLLQENPRWRHVIENRLLQFTWVGDMLMFPRDPLGRFGPSLEQFLKHPQ